MGSIVRIVLFAMSVIVISCVTVSTISIVRSGQSLMTVGSTALHEQVTRLTELPYTQYEGEAITGWDVMLARDRQMRDSSVLVTVCTGDGKIVVYDHGEIYDSLTDADWESIGKGLPDFKGAKLTKEELDGCFCKVVRGDELTADGPEAPGYLNLEARFEGYVQRDVNDSVRMLTFVQV